MAVVGSHWGVKGKKRSALVVGSELDFGLSRMYETMLGMLSRSEINVFRDMTEAKAWVDSAESDY